MIIHCSHKLAAKLSEVSPTTLEETSPLGSWHAHLFTIDRRQCVMFCHDATRFTLFLPGLREEHFAELGSKWFSQLLTATLEASGCVPAQIRKVEFSLGPIRFDTATDRSVQGSLRVAKLDLEAWVMSLPNVMDVDPIAISCKLNHRPTRIYGKFIWPDLAMLEAVAQI